MAVSPRLAAMLARGPWLQGGVPWAVGAAMLLLPLCVGSFSYIRDILPLYYLTKLFPFLLLPLAVRGYARQALPARTLYVVMLCYLVSVPPLLAMAHFGSSLPEAMLTTVKIMPFAAYFIVPEAAGLLRLHPAALRRALVWLGRGTFVLMLVLWVAVPSSAYHKEFGAETVFLNGDEVRGERIQMPMFFGLLYMFLLAQDIARRRRLIDALTLAACYALLLIIYKERIPIAFSLLIVLLAWLTALMGSRLRAMAVIGCVAAGLLAMAPLLPGSERVAESLGGSLIVRIDTATRAWDFIRDDPWRVLFGVGATTPYAAVTINTLFRDPGFYLADIGWLGVVFESGLVGAALIVAVYLVSLGIAQARARTQDVVSMALADYALYAVASTVIYSPTYLPGELATVVALAVLLGRKEGLLF